MSKEDLPIISMGQVKKITELSERQIRYYEEKGLVTPNRTKGGHRLYSYNHIKKLIKIKDYLSVGRTFDEIKVTFNQREARSSAYNDNKDITSIYPYKKGITPAPYHKGITFEEEE